MPSPGWESVSATTAPSVKEKGLPAEQASRDARAPPTGLSRAL